jgi:hypothetical protein
MFFVVALIAALCGYQGIYEPMGILFLLMSCTWIKESVQIIGVSKYSAKEKMHCIIFNAGVAFFFGVLGTIATFRWWIPEQILAYPINVWNIKMGHKFVSLRHGITRGHLCTCDCQNLSEQLDGREFFRSTSNANARCPDLPWRADFGPALAWHYP